MRVWGSWVRSGDIENKRLKTTAFDEPAHHRRSVRLKGYNYAQSGAYFVTICTWDKKCLFGEIANETVTLNAYGEIAKKEWLRSPEIRGEITLDAFVVMPNHVHGIVIISEENAYIVGAHGRAPLRRQPKSLGSFVAGFKSATTKRIREKCGTPNAKIWQRNYYEHIVRNEEDLENIREYITGNPALWEKDEYHVRP